MFEEGGRGRGPGLGGASVRRYTSGSVRGAGLISAVSYVMPSQRTSRHWASAEDIRLLRQCSIGGRDGGSCVLSPPVIYSIFAVILEDIFCEEFFFLFCTKILNY